MSNVVDFPTPESMKNTKKFMNKAQSGQKPSRQEANMAVIESHQMIQGLQTAIGRLAQGFQALEQGVQSLDTHIGILLHTLIDKNVITQQDLEASWEKYVVAPQEEALTKHIELLKQQSAEDAFFATVLEKTRVFEFPNQELNGEEVKGVDIRRYFMSALTNPASRNQVLPELRQFISDLPEYNPPQEVPEEPSKRPDCGYCDAPECLFCNPVPVADTTDPSTTL